jgi:hypothetical protein
MNMDCQQRVKVGIRIRPLGEKEVNEGAQSIVTTKNGKSVHCLVPSRQNTYNFDWVFASTDSQKKVYKELCKSILDNIFTGINSTVLACKHCNSINEI